MTMTIQEYFGDWCDTVDIKEADRIMKYFISTKQPICPLPKDIFKAFRLCPLSKLRMVILGQDPYPNLRNGLPVATGLAFANSSDTPKDSYSPSLEVLRDSIIDFSIPDKNSIFDPSLEKWEEQGILLLNTALTCPVGKTGAHSLLWRPFIISLLTNLSKQAMGTVYVLMGASAQTFEDYIDHRLNYVTRIRHPSYYARTKTKMPSNIWRDVEQKLEEIDGYGIEWI